MKIDEAVKIVKTGLIWANWSEEQSEAFRTLILEVERVKILEEENAELRKRINN